MVHSSVSTDPDVALPAPSRAEPPPSTAAHLDRLARRYTAMGGAAVGIVMATIAPVANPGRPG